MKMKINSHKILIAADPRRSNRRAAMCVENIFFKTKKPQMKILLGRSQIALRKCKGNSRSINAGQLKHEGAIEYLIHLDEGFQFLRALTTTTTTLFTLVQA